MMEGEPVLGVFVPGLMGAGILVSGGILIADGVRKLLPNRGVRRQVTVSRGVRGVVAGAARAAGLEVRDHDLFRREPRSRWTYLALGLALGAVAALSFRAGVGAFVHRGTLHGNPWAIGLGVGFGSPFLLAAGVALVLAALHRRSPRPLLRLVGRTWFGHLRPLPEDPRERALALVPLAERPTAAELPALDQGDAP